LSRSSPPGFWKNLHTAAPVVFFQKTLTTFPARLSKKLSFFFFPVFRFSFEKWMPVILSEKKNADQCIHLATSGIARFLI
jgi:hypothetical protein